jgi:hypothetical protein
MHSPETSLTVFSKAGTKVSWPLLIGEYAALRRVVEHRYLKRLRE